MKKILLATTALAATSGAAYADMSVSGSAEIGIIGASNIETQLFTDVDVNFSGSGETDGGLAFGFSVDLDESDGNPSAVFGGTTEGGETIFISGNFGTLTWGDTDGALDWAMTEVGIGGSINDDQTGHIGYNGNAGLDGVYDGQIVRYDYSFGAFAVAASVEMDDTGVGDPIFGVGGSYSGAVGGIDLSAGLGFQTTDTNGGGAGGDWDLIGVSLGAGFAGGFEGRLNYTSYDGAGANAAGTDAHTGIGLGYSAGAITVGFNYGIYDLVGGGENTGWGLAADYDLGGGAELQFGYGSSDPAVGGTTDSFSLGVAMSF